MKWIKELIEKNTIDGVFDSDKFNEELKKEFPKHAVPKESYNNLAETKTKLEQDIAERDTQLENLKKIDAEGLQAEITRLQEENNTAQENYQKELKELQLTNAIKVALNGKVFDEDLTSGLIKRDQLVINEDGKIVGLDDQLNTLKESKSFLFKSEKTDEDNKQGFKKIGNGPQDNETDTSKAISAAFGNVKE